MRTPKQILYDRLYYTIDLDILCHFFNLRCRRAMRKHEFDASFYKAYREKVVPYWKQFGVRPKIYWFKRDFLRTGIVDPRYIPADIFRRYVIPYFDNECYVRQMTDKNLYHLILPGLKRPETIFKYADGCYREDDLRPITPEEAASRLTCGQYIFKPARDTGGGSGISFLPVDENTPPSAIEDMMTHYVQADHIVQRVLVQHPSLAAFNHSSVNTLRLVTLVFHGKAYLLSAILRIGHADSRVDNVSKGGYQAIVREDGTLEKLAYTHKGGKDNFVEQTDEGVRFEGFAIPSWEKVRATALDLALKMPHLALIGWDFSVDEQGDPVLIEFNCHIGQNQENCGPTFGDMTEEILTEVFRDKKLRL